MDTSASGGMHVRAGPVGVDLQIDLRLRRMQCGQAGQKKLAGKKRRNPQTQGATPRSGAQLARGRIEPLEQVLDLRQIGRARIREGQGPGAPVE